MSGCAFLSMWVQNTSAVAMVMPIVEAVLQQTLKASEEDLGGEDNPGLEPDGSFLLLSSCATAGVVMMRSEVTGTADWPGTTSCQPASMFAVFSAR